MKVNFSFYFFLSILSLAFGQETKKDSITQLDEVVVSDSAKITMVTRIFPSQTITKKTLSARNPIDMASAINQLPGVYMLSGALNTNRITMRGVGSRTPYGTNKLRLYYNGIPITNGNGFSTIEAFDLENLNAIELIKGPKGTAYGANLGGALLMYSKEPSTDQTTFTKTRTLGSYGLSKHNASVFHKEEDNFTLEMHTNHLRMNGYRENSHFKRDGVLLNTSAKIASGYQIGLLLNYIDYTAQIPSSLGKSAFGKNPKQADANWKEAQGYEANKSILLGVYQQFKLSEKLRNTTTIFYSYLDHYEPRPFNILDEFTNGFGFRTLFSGNSTLFNMDAKYYLGAELYKDEYHWGTYENLYGENNGKGSLQGSLLSRNLEFRRQSNIFGSFILPITNRFTAQLGLALNKTHYDFRDRYHSGTENKSSQRNFKPLVLPNLTLSYRILSNQMLYANISRGFSNPSLEETLTPEGVINPDISQETGINYEVGTSLMAWDQKLKITLELYRMDIKNLLVAQRVDDDQYIGKNAGSTRHQGMDVSLSYTFTIMPSCTLNPYISYTFSDHHFVDFVDGGNSYSANPLTGVPSHRVSSGVQLQHASGFYWSLSHQFVGKIPLTDANTLASKSFSVLNTLFGYKKEVLDKLTLGINFGANNLFDTLYAQSVLINAVGFGGAEPRYYYPGNGRNIYGGLEVRYRL